MNAWLPQAITPMVTFLVTSNWFCPRRLDHPNSTFKTLVIFPFKISILTAQTLTVDIFLLHVSVDRPKTLNTYDSAKNLSRILR
jgi:hypothetical protein